MSKYKRYSGEFLSRAGIVWRVDLLQEADEAFTEVGELTFEADEALVIEWDRVDKEEPICGSTATLKIESPGDRTYEDLYTITPGAIRMDVYREGLLYWSGALDPEFYEEPYEKAANYVVTLTFSDFGILDRLKYDLTGLQTVRRVLEYSLQQAGLLYTAVNIDYVSSTTAGDTTQGCVIGSVADSGGLSVRSDNFIDEDGEQLSLYEALEGILQPLAIRMVQRAGVIYLYDINGLYNEADTVEVEWDGDSQTLSVDKVANNIVVTFSPYASSEIISGDLEYGGTYSVDLVNLANISSSPAAYGAYYSYYPDYSDDSKNGVFWDYNLIDFTIFIHPDGSGLKSIGDGCKYFHVLPVVGSGSETTGVAYAFRTGGHGSILTSGINPLWVCHSSVPHGGTDEVLTSNRVFLPTLSITAASKYRVCVQEEVLIDARYNPFSGSSSGNDEGNDELVKLNSAFVFIPAQITLYDEAGTALYHYSNRSTATSAVKCHLGSIKGEWIAGPDPGGDCWLEYYNLDDLEDDCGIRGWQSNRQCIGRPDGRGGRMGLVIFESFKKMDTGEYMPYPPCAGYLEVKICAGVNGYDFGQKVDDCEFGSTSSQWDVKGVYGILRWCLYKAPVVKVVNNNLVFESTELDDIEYSGYINKSALEELSIDTICGTASVCPTAKGAFYLTETGEQMQKIVRAERADAAEKLFIGSIYSQYASRKTTLSGAAVIDGGMHCYTEQNQGDKKFMLMSDTQDVIMDCTEAEYCEIRPDEYDEIEEVG